MTAGVADFANAVMMARMIVTMRRVIVMIVVVMRMPVLRPMNVVVMRVQHMDLRRVGMRVGMSGV